MESIRHSINQLHRALCEYIEATYHISATSLVERRKTLLDEPGVIHQIPYIESTPRYRNGKSFSEIIGLPSAALDVFTSIATPNHDLPKHIHDPPYQHQFEAIKGSLIDDRNLIVTTGTGSGKTESFLLPILGKLAHEAELKPETFATQRAIRALVLYPMNALVNDQLGRLRRIFGDPRLVSLFESWAGRPPRFGRYTSRTPYAGVRTPNKDYNKFRAFRDFYVDIEHRANDQDSDGHAEALRVKDSLKNHGKWPGKPDLGAWLGEVGSNWQDSDTGAFKRAITLQGDSELITRHEIQLAPPDILVTNYSMLEYMMMRPIERPIFDLTRTYFEQNPDEVLFVVLDEAHLYRGAAGAEVSLLLRRLRDRLDIPVDRFRVICTTASFNDRDYAKEFSAQLCGLPADSFLSIAGSLDLRSNSDIGSNVDAEALANIDIEEYYAAQTDTDRFSAVASILEHLEVSVDTDIEGTLYQAFRNYPPMGRLINLTMKQAMPVAELGQQIFPNSDPQMAERAANALMVLGNVARRDSFTPSLYPSRIHSFFRGLPGLWICMDPNCNKLEESDSDGICGMLYSQPRESCECGARVLELFTCRNCGSAYARAYTHDIDCPSTLWSNPSEGLRMIEGETIPLFPIDLLLESPSSEEIAEPAEYDLETGRLNPPTLGPRMRQVYLRSDRLSEATDDDDEDVEPQIDSRGQFKPCGVCGTTSSQGKSSVQDHQTKGDQPFQALVGRQLQIQQPSLSASTSFAPLQGRKVLTFSDSRQVAARLAPNLQLFAMRDSLRPLIVWGYMRLQSDVDLRPSLDLNDLYLAVLLAANSLQVRLRPQLKAGESFAANLKVSDALRAEESGGKLNLSALCMQIRSERPPESLLEQIVVSIQDRYLGLEQLAVASFVERADLKQRIFQLPDISGIAETNEAKIELSRAWLRCWRNYGFWIGAMPPNWGVRPRSQGISVRPRKGKFNAMRTILVDREAREIFNNQWYSELLEIFTDETASEGFRRMQGSALTLEFEGDWVRCRKCKSVHRPVSTIEHCLDCGSNEDEKLNPEEDSVFLARKGFYRNPITEALSDPPNPPVVLVAAEHTAQLNAPQNEDVFSKAEENELLFQDINLGNRVSSNSAVDVLSSTTTMEVGIDIGSLSAVALRNMPPGRANYQQRSGRAGRRSNTVATVIAFGSADSHDEHYFSNPDAMIRGEVIDPKLTLDNPDIVRRHIRAFLVQSYHQERISGLDPGQNQDLFSVLGTVSDFKRATSILNREDFAQWLQQNENQLRNRVSLWIPEELNIDDRNTLLEKIVRDCISSIDDAIGPSNEENYTTELIEDETLIETQPEEGEERPLQPKPQSGKLLHRLLYSGILPRYAFPTDVATFHVFDIENSTQYRPILRFAPQQGLSVALTQYAPSKQVWISGKCYTSNAVYSVDPDARFGAWESKRIYMECYVCGFANTYMADEVQRDETQDCPACGGEETFGPGKYWIRPPGFAHPVDSEELTSPDDIPETSYATRAKLTMDTPGEHEAWTVVNERLRVLPLRRHLLASNTGPRKDGYTYCTKCGRIEASVSRTHELDGSHLKPYPVEDEDATCDGLNPTRHLVLGTDFVTDIALFSLRVNPPLRLLPGFTATIMALRTVSEALATSACRLLELEQGEIMAEFRPALTTDGMEGLEAEIFLYDLLPGGAGFSTQLPELANELLYEALLLLTNCEEGCDASCYRCLRSFKNKFEHAVLDRHVGAQLIQYLIDGHEKKFSPIRLDASTTLLRNDLERQSEQGIKFDLGAPLQTDGSMLAVPILATKTDGQRFVIALSDPLTPNRPADDAIENLRSSGQFPVIVENELLIRGDLPTATRRVLDAMN